MNALQTLLKTDPSQVDGFSVQQVVALCGSGKLTDDSPTSCDLRSYLQIARAKIVTAISAQYDLLVKKSRALYWSSDKSVRAAITISKQYAGGNYWYAYHPEWDVFLSEASKGFFVLGCIGRDEAFALPFDWIHQRLHSLYVTEREGKHYWHIHLWPKDDSTMVFRKNDGTEESVGMFAVQLNAAK